MNKEFLKELLDALNQAYEEALVVKKHRDEFTPEELLDIIEYILTIKDGVDYLLVHFKDEIKCMCDIEEIVNNIKLIVDKLMEFVKEFEIDSLKDEFTSKMFKIHSTVLYERKLGFLVDENTYKRILAYIRLNDITSLSKPQFSIVVKHPAFTYTMQATVRTKDFLDRVITSKTRYSPHVAPYLYLDIEDFKQDAIHGIEVMNITDNYNILSYFTYYAASVKSTVVSLNGLEDVPVALYGETSTTVTIDNKQMMLHEFIKMMFEKEVVSGTYDKRFTIVKYVDDSYLMKDLTNDTDKVLLIVKKEEDLDKIKDKCCCKCKHTLRK